MPEPDVSATSKRKRKPPGEWWLSQHDESNAQEQQEAVQPLQELKSNKKTKKKSPVVADSSEQEIATCWTSESIQNELVTVQKVPKTLKKSQAEKSLSNRAGSRKNPKLAGGRRKKSGAQDQREMTPTLTVEEEARDNEASGQLSPVACSQNPRQRNETPGKYT